MNKNTAIKVKHVSKDFKLPHEKTNSIKSGVVNLLKKKSRSMETQHALRDVSFEVKKGEFFGIVGRNGSGKSTLLKMLAKIYTPTGGKIVSQGKIVSFIELGVGFNPELTGRDNIYLNGALLGFSRSEIELMYDDIVAFAELERFMDQKLKNYSSGMQIRLAFSIAIKAKGDILILDEVLAVGDEAFQRKCSEYFHTAKELGKTVVLVTHSMEDVRRFCDRAVLINEGVVGAYGDPGEVANEYSKLFIEETEHARKQDKRFGDGRLEFHDVEYEINDQYIEVSLSVRNNTEEVYGDIFVGFNIRQDGELVGGNTFADALGFQEGLTLNGGETRRFVARLDNVLGSHDYTIDLTLRAENGLVNFDTILEAIDIKSAKGRETKYYRIFVPISVQEVS